MRKTLLALGTGALVLSAALTAQAFHNPQDYSLFGEATYISPGNASNRAVHLVSDASPGFGGIDYGVEADTTFAELTTLSSDFKVEADDTCVGGSPRYQVGIDTDGDGDRDANIFVYFGTDSGGTPCVPGTWQNTGDVLESGRVLDTSQLPGGTFYDPYNTALAKYGTMEVTGIQVVVDAGWAAGDGEQAADIDNTLINNTLFTYEIPQPTGKDQCKKGGWQNLARADGTTFKNQGDCIQYANTGK